MQIRPKNLFSFSSF